jgi:hypothetical protein
MEMHGADALYSAVKSLMHAMWTEDQDAQQDVAHRMIEIAKSWTIRRWVRIKTPEWETSGSESEHGCSPC